ncbi:MAG: TIGR01212 family radical SAM protein [Desulfobacteraceae bacterium]|nr:TIGR01212 family radical SAM protein [Desulfobacteraceae bacterium]
MPERYRDFNTHLRALFGCRVQKISVDAGLTCPNRDGRVGTGGCIYCNARGSGTGAHGRGLSVTEQLRQGKTALARRYKARKFLAYFQSFCNTYAPLETLRRLYAEALGVPDIVGLAIGTRPDCVDTGVLELLEELARGHLIWIEYGLQSAHDTTLARLNRGHTFGRFAKAVAATRQRGIRICTHVILGLPGETRKQMLATADAVAALGIDGIKLHLLYVVRGTPLEALYRAGRYTCLEQAAYVDLVCDFIERLPPEMVIQRLTGDPHPEELVAPRWSLKKSETRALIQAALAQRDSWQGKRCQQRGTIGR